MDLVGVCRSASSRSCYPSLRGMGTEPFVCRCGNPDGCCTQQGGCPADDASLMPFHGCTLLYQEVRRPSMIVLPRTLRGHEVDQAHAVAGPDVCC